MAVFFLHHASHDSPFEVIIVTMYRFIDKLNSPPTTTELISDPLDGSASTSDPPNTTSDAFDASDPTSDASGQTSDPPDTSSPTFEPSDMSNYSSKPTFDLPVTSDLTPPVKNPDFPTPNTLVPSTEDNGRISPHDDYLTMRPPYRLILESTDHPDNLNAEEPTKVDLDKQATDSPPKLPVYPSDPNPSVNFGSGSGDIIQ